MDNSPSNGSHADWRGGPVMVGSVILHSDIITEHFCCDMAACCGACCEQGDAGAPVTLDEIEYIEEQLDAIWPHMSAGAQAEIDHHGVAYPDPEGEMVTSIVRGGDCAFRGCNGCLLPVRPVSCHLYPIREKAAPPYTLLNYHRWDICRAAIGLGKRRNIRLYQFAREPLIRRFGSEWYAELELTAEELRTQGLLA